MSAARRTAAPFVVNAAFLPYLTDARRFVREILHWTPDAKQDEILAQAPHKRIILNWGRQCGKSTLIAARVVHWAVTRPGSLTIIIGGVETHVAELFERIDHFLAAMDWTSRGQTGKRISRRLPNRSRIVAATTNTGSRSHAASLVVLDEASYIKDGVWDGVLPTLAVTDGALMIASTPQGTSGRFYDIWRAALAGEATPQWLHSAYPATANPRIKASFLDEMRRIKGESYVRQEFLCEFVENGRSLIARELVENLFSLE